MGGILVLIVWG